MPFNFNSTNVVNDTSTPYHHPLKSSIYPSIQQKSSTLHSIPDHYPINVINDSLMPDHYTTNAVNDPPSDPHPTNANVNNTHKPNSKFVIPPRVTKLVNLKALQTE